MSPCLRRRTWISCAMVYGLRAAPKDRCPPCAWAGSHTGSCRCGSSSRWMARRGRVSGRLLFDLFANWYNFDGVPTLDPDSSDRTPPQAKPPNKPRRSARSTARRPTSIEIRLRPVDDAYRELSEGYDFRVSVLGRAVRYRAQAGDPQFGWSIDFVYADPDELDQHPWYQSFAELRECRPQRADRTGAD